MVPSLWVISQLAGGRLITLDHFRHGRGSVFVLFEINTYSGYRFDYPVHSASAKLASMDLENALSVTVVFTQH